MQSSGYTLGYTLTLLERIPASALPGDIDRVEVRHLTGECVERRWRQLDQLLRRIDW
jgi:hypothetical protein